MSRWWTRAREHLGLGRGGEVHAEQAHVEQATAEQGWDRFDRALAGLAGAGEREPVDAGELIARLGELPDRPPPADPERWARLGTVARRLVRQNQHEAVRELLAPVLETWQPDPRTGLPALAAHAELAVTGHPPQDLAPAAAAALEGADHALAGGDLHRAADLVVIGAGLLLHRDLHADVPQSPLVEDPESFLAPFRRSTAMAALAAPAVRDGGDRSGGEVGTQEVRGQAMADRSGGAARRTRVVVLPGAYPRFATPVVEALRQRRDVRVRVLPLIKRHRAFRWLGTDPELVRLRLAAAAGEPVPAAGVGSFAVDDELLRHLREADVVLADWADKGAVWASLLAPPSVRLVVRAHGMDTFGLWVHAIDWSRVDALVTVSPHQADILDDVLRHGAVPAAPPCQVVPNLVHLPEVTDPPPRVPHTLALVGWGKRVKDPLWAVEVLAGLLARGDDGDWRLRLIGDGFTPGGVATSREYAERFAERTARSDVADHIDLVPQTDDVAWEVAGVGFVLSASIRESFHLGLVEGVLGGAVPVVRDWPFVASRDGARRLYPRDWVVPDVTAAVERIWALREPGDRDTAAADARSEATSRFSPEQTTAALVRHVLVTPSRGTRPAPRLRE